MSTRQRPISSFPAAAARAHSMKTTIKDFLDETGKPTSKAIVEGANLYLTPWARRALEKLGVIIIKDSSANKGGVICSSFEVLCGLVLSEEEIHQRKAYPHERDPRDHRSTMPEMRSSLTAQNPSKQLAFLTDISEWISERINTYTYQLLDYLQNIRPYQTTRKTR